MFRALSRASPKMVGTAYVFVKVKVHKYPAYIFARR